MSFGLLVLSRFHFNGAHGFGNFWRAHLDVSSTGLSITEDSEREESCSVVMTLIVQCSPEITTIISIKIPHWHKRRSSSRRKRQVQMQSACLQFLEHLAASVHRDNLNEFRLIISSEAAEIPWMSDASLEASTMESFQRCHEVERHTTRNAIDAHRRDITRNYWLPQIYWSNNTSDDFK